MTGGGGADVFVFASGEGGTNANRDVITDFASGEDLIMVTGLLRGEFTWLGTGGFAATGNSQARASATNLIAVDTDGNGIINFEIQLTGVTAANLKESDFLWT